MLFRALACFLSKHAAPPMMDKCITELTVHDVTQAIVSLQEDTDDETAVDAGITIYVEPAEFFSDKIVAPCSPLASGRFENILPGSKTALPAKRRS